MRGAPATDRYRVLRRIGQGGMGMVYEAEDHESGQRVALKTIASHDVDHIYRLKREFRLLADLSHPNLVELYDLVVDREACFYTMELLDGTDLLSYVWRERREQEMAMAQTSDAMPTPGGGVADAPTRDIIQLPSPCDVERLRPALAQLARGMGALHAAGKVHRDVKPSNILVTRDGRVVLLDFGLAAELGRRPSSAGVAVVGTIPYMAPEQCAGDGRITAAADWYALGVMLFQALTGRLPFDGPPAQVLHDKQTQAAPRVSMFTSDAPDDLARLCDELLERAPADRPGGPALLRRLGVSDPLSVQASHSACDATFAGRDAELAQLDQLLLSPAGGQAAVAVVRGPSGMGKSALIDRFADRVVARDPDALVLRGRCYAREDVPYKAMDGLIDELSEWWLGRGPSEAQALLPRAAWLLPRLFPVLGRVPAIADAPHTASPVNPQTLRTDAFAALREALRRLADRRRVVLVLDDMQWVDRDTTTLLTDLMRAPDPPPLLLVLGTRSKGSEGVIEHARHMDATLGVIDVGPLPEEVSIALAADQLGDDGGEIATQLVHESAGSPLFLAELIRLLQRRSLASVAGKGLETVLAERFDELGADARTLAELVAVAGEPIARQLVARASGLAPAEFNRQLAHLRAQRIVRTTGGRTDDTVEPFHDRVREVMVDVIPPERRVLRHRALATALSGIGAADRLAHHWSGAGDVDRAGEYARRAGDDARAKLDFDRAARFYRMALASSRWPADEQRTLRGQLAEALADSGQPRDAAREALAAAEGSDATTALELRRRAAGHFLQSGYIEEGLKLTHEVLAQVGMRMARTPTRALLSVLLRRAWLRVRGLGFRKRAPAEISQAEMTRVDVCEGVSFGLALVDTFRAMDFGSRFLVGALRLGEPWRVARAIALETDLLAASAKTRRARRLLDRLAAMTPEVGDPEAEAQLLATRALFDFFCTNDLHAALDGMHRSMEAYRVAVGRAGFALDTINLFRCWSLLYMGELAELSRLAPALAEAALRSGNLYSSVTLRCGFAAAWLPSLDAEAIDEQVVDALRSWSTPSGAYQFQHFVSLNSRVDLALYRGDPDSISAQIEADRRPIRRSLLDRAPMQRALLCSSLTRHALARATAAPAGSRARRDALADARRHARRVRRIPLPLAEASLLVFRGAIADVDGRDDEAANAWRAALPRLEAMHYHLFAHATRYHLGRLLGGDEGRELRARTTQWLEEQQVRDPQATMRMILPAREP